MFFRQDFLPLMRKIESDKQLNVQKPKKKYVVFRLKTILSTLNEKMCAAFKYSVRIYYKLIKITLGGILLVFDASMPHAY